MINTKNSLLLPNNLEHTSISSMIMILSDWSFISVNGKDSKKYLHTQLTSDIEKLNITEHIFTAHCNSMGKIWSTLRLFYYKHGFGYIIRNSIISKQLSEIKKYAVFSDITFKYEHDITILGVIGYNTCHILKKFFSKIPNKYNTIVHNETSTILYLNIPIPRFLILTHKIQATNLIKHYRLHGDNNTWLSLDIAAGIANIDINHTSMFTPQAINLENFSNSISFSKGCYLGQEIISKIKYRHSNKRSMYWLLGTAKFLPKSGQSIDWKDNENNWHSNGIILTAVRLNSKIVSIQIVMNNDIPLTSTFRISKDENSRLKIQNIIL
uniref:tRNA-modifying protein YgfZ n=1 Tax=Candidatus Aschnera chinzeii TaxID=1485666 RepID=A0AAT9G3W4_9ENTR|nr:MAG: tRNA-modifying protein YgfZ [Candidatus Aschnera chinzeii]